MSLSGRMTSWPVTHVYAGHIRSPGCPRPQVVSRRFTGGTTASSAAAMRIAAALRPDRSSTATSGSGTLAGQRSRSLTASFCGHDHVIGLPGRLRQPGHVLVAEVVMVLPGGDLHLRRPSPSPGRRRRPDRRWRWRPPRAPRAASRPARDVPLTSPSRWCSPRCTMATGPAIVAARARRPAPRAASGVARFRVTITTSARSSAPTPRARARRAAATAPRGSSRRSPRRR